MKAPRDQITPLEEKDRESLLRHIDDLDALLATNSMIASSLDLTLVLDIITNQARERLGAEICSFFLLDPEKKFLELAYTTHEPSRREKIRVPLEQGIAGQVARTGKPVSLVNVADEENFFAEVDNITGIETRSYLCVPIAFQDEILGTAQLINKMDGGYFHREEALLFEGFARQAGMAIQNYYLMGQQLEKKRMEHELAVCANIQKKTLPEAMPDLPGYTVTGTALPARSVGGDWFDFLPGPDGRQDVVVADVSGKGIVAALIVAKAHAGLRALNHFPLDLAEICERLNRIIFDSVEFGRFISLFYARLRPESGHLEYVSAGHDNQLLLRADGTTEVLLNSSKILGIDPGARYASRETTIHPGDLLVLFSDGMTEAMNEKSEFFGEKALEECLRREMSQNPDISVEDLSRAAYQRIREFMGKNELLDDATLVLIRRSPA